MSVPSLRDRASGILLHLSSLPGPHGNGDLGDEARQFAEFLSRAGQRWWQMLPVGPAGYGDSPYSATSAFAGNPLFIDLDAFGSAVSAPAGLSNATRVDYAASARFREEQLRRSLGRLDADALGRLRAFCEREAGWLEDFALFDALKRVHGGRAWTEWEEDVRMRRPDALARTRRELRDDIAFARAAQWAFDGQWNALHAYCTARGIGLIGDLPLYVAHDSADVWQHRELFDLDERGLPRHVAGVPPDYFSTTGQRWGNPLYRWKVLAKTGYRWWVDRLKAALSRFDVVRLDHFIGFARYWRVPAAETTAVHGVWMHGPGRALFDALAAELGRPPPLIAEDLGEATPKVNRLRRALGFPGLRIVQFAFSDVPQASAFLPHNHHRNAVVYTGTHDNDTVQGWFATPGEVADRERRGLLAYLGKRPDERIDPSSELIRLAMGSVARTCIIPLQDVLGLGSEARLNVPGTTQGNWQWRVPSRALTADVERRLRTLTQIYDRLGPRSAARARSR